MQRKVKQENEAALQQLREKVRKYEDRNAGPKVGGGRVEGEAKVEFFEGGRCQRGT